MILISLNYLHILEIIGYQVIVLHNPALYQKSTFRLLILQGRNLNPFSPLLELIAELRTHFPSWLSVLCMQQAYLVGNQDH